MINPIHHLSSHSDALEACFSFEGLVNYVVEPTLTGETKKKQQLEKTTIMRTP